MSKKFNRVQNQLNRSEIRDEIEQQIQKGVDEELLRENELTDIYYLCQEHLIKYGYEPQPLGNKTIPPREGVSEKPHHKRPQQKPHSAE